jgi:hypothetical protein
MSMHTLNDTYQPLTYDSFPDGPPREDYWLIRFLVYLHIALFHSSSGVV